MEWMKTQYFEVPKPDRPPRNRAAEKDYEAYERYIRTRFRRPGQF